VVGTRIIPLSEQGVQLAWTPYVSCDIISCMTDLKNAPLYERIYAVTRQIPAGIVSTYGQIATIVGRGCTARQVGYAMAALKSGDKSVPWQRVINSQGKISLRAGGGGARQRQLLEAEGVEFDVQGQTDFNRFGWAGPDWEWLEKYAFSPAPSLSKPGNEASPGEQLSLF
jgi:methylated-DNA-protein-cysteine methyltransferase-like protein